jgi:hypothetical protein
MTAFDPVQKFASKDLGHSGIQLLKRKGRLGAASPGVERWSSLRQQKISGAPVLILTAWCDQPFDALRAQASDDRAIGTDSLTSTTGTTLTSFQKVNLEMNEATILGSLASIST